jgi:hypothetical protein
MRRIATAVLTATLALGLGGRLCRAEGAPADGAAAPKVDLKLPAADAASIAQQGEAKGAASDSGAATAPGAAAVGEPTSATKDTAGAKKDTAAGASSTKGSNDSGSSDEGSKKVKSAKGSKGGKATAESGEEKLKHLQETFTAFCDSWVDKLRERQRHNLATIKWQTSPEGVVGEYVGYDTDHIGPETVDHPDETPIGKLVYIELKLRLAGPTEAHALAKEPEVIERTEVTELFRFNQGAWVY